MQKTCRKCGQEKELCEFYRQKGHGDRRMAQCKECIKQRVRSHRSMNLEKIHKYDRERFMRPERKRQAAEYQRNRRLRDRTKDNARQEVRRAVASGKIQRRPCVVCGNSDTEAHHTDYANPLEVTWYCFEHHRTHGHKQVVTVTGFTRRKATK